MLMLKNLNDSKTRQEILSKVKEINLDDTIAFIEARETSKNATNTLDRGIMSMEFGSQIGSQTIVQLTSWMTRNALPVENKVMERGRTMRRGKQSAQRSVTNVKIVEGMVISNVCDNSHLYCLAQI